MAGFDPNDAPVIPAQNLPSILALDYEHFVECAFLTILNRSADSEALEHYVERLKAGHPKLAILDALYKSDEARAANVQITWLRNAILRYKLTNIPFVRLAFMSDRRDIRLEFEHRLHAMEKNVALLTTQTAALVRELAELSSNVGRVAKHSESARPLTGDLHNQSNELLNQSLIAKRVYEELSDASDKKGQ